MKELDLIPAWYLEARTQRRDRVIRAAYLAAVVAAMAALSVVRQAQNAAAADALVGMKRGLEHEQRTDGSLAALRARWTGLERRGRLLAEADGGAPAYAIIAELSKLMPEATILTGLDLADIRWPDSPGTNLPAGTIAAPGPRQGRLAVRGVAASDNQVGRLMADLGHCAVFANVALKYSKPVQVEGREARSFELACGIPSFE